MEHFRVSSAKTRARHKNLGRSLIRRLEFRVRDTSVQFLRTLVNTPSPPGHEARGQRVWLDYIRPFADETFSDAHGNCVAVLNKGGSPRLMLAGHADAVLAAGMFHFGDYTIEETKRAMAARGVVVRTYQDAGRAASRR